MPPSPRTPRQPEPTSVAYATDAERLEALRADNEALQAMIKRLTAHGPTAAAGGASSIGAPGATGASPAGPRTPGASCRTQRDDRYEAEIHRREQQLAQERERRIGAESMLAEARAHAETAARKAETELARVNDLLLGARGENLALKERLREAEGLVAILKKENFRLAACLKEHNIAEPSKDEPPEYFTIGHGARADRIRKDVPSSKPFAHSIRSMSPNSLAAQIFSPTKHKMSLRTTYAVPPAVASSSSRTPSRSGGGNAGEAANNGSANGNGRSPSADNKRRVSAGSSPAYATTNANSSTANAATRARSTSPSTSARRPHFEFKVGSRVTWNGQQAVVKYVGAVHTFGEGVWFGLELAIAGRGEHNGTINGVRYFSAAPHAGVFAQQHELRPGREYVFAPSAAATANDTAGAEANGAPTAAARIEGPPQGSRTGSVKATTAAAPPAGAANVGKRTPTRAAAAAAPSPPPKRAPVSKTSKPAAAPAAAPSAAPAAEEQPAAPVETPAAVAPAATPEPTTATAVETAGSAPQEEIQTATPAAAVEAETAEEQPSLAATQPPAAEATDAQAPDEPAAAAVTEAPAPAAAQPEPTAVAPATSEQPASAEQPAEPELLAPAAAATDAATAPTA